VVFCQCGRPAIGDGLCSKCYYQKSARLRGVKKQKWFGTCIAETHPEAARELIDKSLANSLSAGSKVVTDWKCSTCGIEWPAMVSTRTVQGCGCKNCARYGFKSDAASFVYLVHRPGQIKIGIANHESGRMDKHQRHGWRVLCKIEMNGIQAMSLEKTVKSALKANGVPTGGAAFMSKFDGYTEAWPEECLKVRTIRGLCRKLGINLEAFLAA